MIVKMNEQLRDLEDFMGEIMRNFIHKKKNIDAYTLVNYNCLLNKKVVCFLCGNEVKTH